MMRRAPALAAPLALLALLMMPSGAAFAQDYEDLPQTLERSLYLQVAGLIAFENFDSGRSGKNSGGFSMRVGLRTAAWGAVEAQFEWVRGMEPDGNDAGDDWTTTFNARIYPLTDKIMDGRVQPYLLVGVGATSYKLNDFMCGKPGGPAPPCGDDGRHFGFSSRWGGGVDVYITDKVGVTLDCTYIWAAGTPIKDLSYLSLGLGAIYRFY